MSEFQTKIQQFFTNQNNLQKMKEVLVRNNAYNDGSFQELINSLMDGDRDLSMVGDYLMAEFDLPFEVAEKISDDLMDAGLSEIYFDIYQNYTEHQKEMDQFVAENFGVADVLEEAVELSAAAGVKTTAAPTTPTMPATAPVDLAAMYQQFARSSLFLNALEAEKNLVAQAGGQEINFKNLFYGAINAADAVKVFGALRHIFSSGVKKFFHDDKRYADFMNKYLAKSNNNETMEQWNNNPVDKKYIMQFIRLILEKKLHLSAAQSAMMGVTLGALARASGEEEFGDVAYGDEEKNEFMWND